MTLSIWRYAHLTLAIISCVFMLILSVTGVILAIDAVNEKVPAYRSGNFDSLNLAQVIPALQEVYPEIIELAVDHNQFVTLEATDEDGNSIKAYVDPLDGKVLGQVEPKSDFVQWNLALHRSLFLKETGRIIVGVVSFLLFLICISGIVLIIKRQQGIRHFFAKINRDFFAQYFHVASGRLLLIPVLALALTGTYLFLIRIEVVKKPAQETITSAVSDEAVPAKPAEFPVFQQTLLSEVEKVEFPFMEDDPEEFFVLKLKERVVSVHQISGEIVEETPHAYAAVLEKLSLDIHTGRTSIIWAIILGLSSLNIVAFIYTGFEITFRRTRTRISNKFKAADAEIVLLVGTENGSTLFFANQIHHQLLVSGKRSFLTEMNQFESYPNATHLLVFTSTYGLGTAPSNASGFEALLPKVPQSRTIRYAVIGFGSMAYPDFCKYAQHIDQLLALQPWAARYLDLHTVNDKSTGEFVKWVHAWSEKALIPLATAPALYTTKVAGLKKLRVVEKTSVSEDNTTFKVLLKPESGITFQSGDLLTIYPAGDQRERYYSIGRHNDMIQLVVKLYPDGLGSGYLYNLEADQSIQARVVMNATFHFPEHAGGVVMIANGTGIAPFLGMIMNNHKKRNVRLYAGFRYRNELTRQYRQFAEEEIVRQRLTHFEIAYSREEKKEYVMDLIRKDEQYFADLLENSGVIMICGSLRMHKDVEIVLNEICLARNQKQLSYYLDRNQILSDCY